MGLAPSSKQIVLLSVLISVISIIIASLLSIILGFHWFHLISSSLSLSTLFLIWTFRDPDRFIVSDEKVILAPADGILTGVNRDEDQLSFTIRMSPFDVHMNRAPISGIVESVTFRKGSHWPVYFPNYAKKNQRNTIILHNKEKNIQAEVIQVSGIFARRTVSYVTAGDEVKQGEKIGTIRFGSITHLNLKGTKKYIEKCEINTSVRAGKTILAELKTDDDK